MLASRAGLNAGNCSEVTWDALCQPPKEILPESLYAALAETRPPGLHDGIWRTLLDPGTWPTDNWGPFPPPNRTHAALVLAAARSGSVLLTTNFDPFFEQAARIMGVPCTVFTLENISRLEFNTLANAELSILKIHGDATNRHSTLISKSPDLGRAAAQLERLRIGKHFERAVIVGYSGRDFDVFPSIKAAGFNEIAWVDPDIAENKEENRHRSRHLTDFIGLTVGGEDIAEYLLKEWESLGDSRARSARMSFESGRRSDELLAKERVRSVVDNAGETIPRDNALWALSRAFADIGRHQVSAELLAFAAPIEPNLVAETLLLESFVAASRDRYRDSRALARAAGREAASLNDRQAAKRLRTRARLHAAYALVLHENLTIPIYASGAETMVRSTWRERTRRSMANIRFAVTAMGSMSIMRRALRAAQAADLGVTVPEYRLACDSIEYVIRLSAFLGRYLPRRDRVFARLDTLALRCGYLTGAINSGKYRKRAGAGDNDVGEDLARFEVLDDLIARAGENRFEAERILNDSSRSRDQAEIVRLTEEGLEAATHAGSPSLQLKIETLRIAAGFIPKLQRWDAAKLLDEIQATFVSRHFIEIRSHFAIDRS